MESSVTYSNHYLLFNDDVLLLLLFVFVLGCSYSGRFLLVLTKYKLSASKCSYEAQERNPSRAKKNFHGTPQNEFLKQ